MRTTAIGLVVVGVFALGACGGDDDTGATDTETDADDTATTVDERGPETAPVADSDGDASSVTWGFDGTAWTALGGTPPACTDPLEIVAPADLALATAALYPGQTRGGNYKPHGGLIFNGVANDGVAVVAPFDAQIVRASRYIEQGEVQYLFDAIAPCGMMFRVDHLLTLDTALQAVADTLPEPAVDDSRTNAVEPPVAVTSGQVLATAVGFPQTANTSFDLGVYDLRAQNAAAQDPAFASERGPELAPYAVCWFDLLPAVDAERVRSLPPGDAVSGATSDYCI